MNQSKPLIFRVAITAICLLYVCISHVVIPTFNNGRDILFFSAWAMFSSGSHGRILDITWGDGKYFLFKDYRLQAKALGIDLPRLHFAMSSRRIKSLRKRFGPSLRKLCQCETLYLVELSGDNYRHHVLKKPLPVVKKIKL